MNFNCLPIPRHTWHKMAVDPNAAQPSVELNELLDGVERMRHACDAKETERIACGSRVTEAQQELASVEMRLDAALSDGRENRAKMADQICVLAQQLKYSGAPEYQFRLTTANKMRELMHLIVAHESELAQRIESVRADILPAKARVEAASTALATANADARIRADALHILEEQIAHICATSL